MSVEELLDSRIAYEGRLINLRVDSVKLPSGRETTREIVEHNGAVVIVAVDAEDHVLLVRQYRSAVGEALIELPAGTKEPDEDPLQCAHRELREETGYGARRMEELGGVYAGPGYSTEYLHLFLATDLHLVGSVMDEDEIMNVFQVPLRQVHEMIDRGEIRDSKSVAGLLWAMHRLRQA